MTAATDATCSAYADTLRSLLTGDADGGHYELQPSRSGTFVFEPRIEGVPKGTGNNVQLFRLQFTFSEILPNYPYPGAVPPVVFSPASMPLSRQGYVQSTTTGLWHKQLAKTVEGADGNMVVEYLDQNGVP